MRNGGTKFVNKFKEGLKSKLETTRGTKNAILPKIIENYKIMRESH